MLFSESSAEHSSRGKILPGDESSSLQNKKPLSRVWAIVLLASSLALSLLYVYVGSSWLYPQVNFKKGLKPIHHGRVEYTVRDDAAEGRVYHREFTTRCGYGILTFNIAAAKSFLPYDFDVYRDEYVYSDNQGLCWLYPTYKGLESGPNPFWEPNDPTLVIVPFGNITRISSRIETYPNTKPLTDAMKPRCGDYTLLAKGNFYSAHFYQQLKNRVNAWKADDSEEMWAEDLAGLLKDS